MLYSSIGIIALIIHLIINYDVLLRIDMHKADSSLRAYRAFVIAITGYYITDILWGFLYERRLIGLTFFDTQLYFTAMAFSVLLWTHYVVIYLNEENRAKQLLSWAGIVLFGFQIIAVIVNFFVPVLFSFDMEGAYHAGTARHISIVLQIAMFFATGIYALVAAESRKDTMKQRNRAIGFFSLAMTGFILGQVLNPLMPLYAVGCLMGSCLLHSFVLENEKDEYRDDLEERLKENIQKGNYYDLLTGLPSMTYFFELAEASKEAIRAKGDNPALLYMDFSGMKFYNTRHGFAEGDKLLQSFARILISIFGAERCCRIGADHFVVQTEETGLEDKIQRMLAECREMNDGKTLPLHVGVYPRQAESVHTSVACDRAKLACSALSGTYGMAVNYYSQDLNDDVEKRQYIIENIDRAIQEKWIQVYYQAIIRVANDRVCDEEALSRWIDPTRGFLSPADFIPALEESKLIYKLDLYVVDQVLEKLKKMAEVGMYVVPQSVNLSRSDFDSCDIVEEIRRRVDDAGIDRSMLTIEITESIIGSDFEFMKEQVERFQELGFQVWMDDFGSGYSSLDVLQSIHFDLIKLDMRFMQQFNNSEESRVILTELARMAAGLGVETVCEGVEKPEQIEFLREIGCTKAQGFHYGKPMPFSALLEWYEGGKDIRFENPEEANYFATLGRINLYDMAAITSEGDDSLREYFNTLPMAVMEVNGIKARYSRCNKSYRDFMERLFGIDVTDIELDSSGLPGGHGAAFMVAVLRCSRDGNRAVVDEPIDERTTVHTFMRRIAVNPVTGTAAIAIAVLSVMEDKGDSGASFTDITRALSSDYINLYYVDLETDQFIEYTPDAGRENLAVERRGDDFFNASIKDAQLFIYKEDRDVFIESFTKENVLRMLDEHGTFTLTYRLLMDGKPTYVNMKAVRMRADEAHIIVGVSNVDAQMRQKEAIARLQEEQTTYARINALSKGFICIYTVDPVTGHYVEYSATRDYAGLGLAKEGDDFWAEAQKNSVLHVYSEDVEKFQTNITMAKVTEEIEKKSLFSLQYRMYLDGEPKYVTAQAALVEEKDGPQLIIGINNVDELVRREQDYEKKLASARSRANLDTLTGVKNKAAYENMSNALTHQIEDGQTVEYAIVLCRVCGLKRVNEEQGHEAGNQLIRNACASICETFKHSPVFRVAGDQFAVISQGQDYEHIDRLVADMDESNSVNHESGGMIIACGMAKYDGSESVSAVFQQADALCHENEGKYQ